jgi:hypothetical protein
MKIRTSQESGKGSFERPHIEEGLYEAKLKEVKEISEGQYGKRVAFVFALNVNAKEVDLTHISYVPEVATPDNKFGKVLLAFGCDLGKEVETDALVGQSVRVMVEDYTYEEDGKKETASSISKVKPLAEIQKV